MGTATVFGRPAASTQALGAAAALPLIQQRVVFTCKACTSKAASGAVDAAGGTTQRVFNAGRAGVRSAQLLPGWGRKSWSNGHPNAETGELGALPSWGQAARCRVFLMPVRMRPLLLRPSRWRLEAPLFASGCVAG